MQALFGGGATNERDELLLLVSEWISGHVDAMVDDFQVRSPRKDGPVGLRGGDEPGPVSYYIEDAVHLRPAVDRVHHRTARQCREREPHERRVHVDDVELRAVPKGEERVSGLVPERLNGMEPTPSLEHVFQ